MDIRMDGHMDGQTDGWRRLQYPHHFKKNVGIKLQIMQKFKQQTSIAHTGKQVRSVA